MTSSSTSANTRLSANIGAHLHGFDLRSRPDDSIIESMRTSVAEHHVIVMRRQHLTADQHAAVAEAFGPIVAPGQLAREITDQPGGSTIENTADRPPACVAGGGS